MKKAISIGGVTFDYPLFISSEFDFEEFTGSKTMAIDGSSVMFIQQKGSLTKEVELFSNENGWISEETRKLLRNTVDGNPKTVVFNDGTQETYYYDHTKTPIVFTALYEGSAWYSVQINLLKG